MKNPLKKLAEMQLRHIIKSYVDGSIEVKINNGTATVYVEEDEIPHLIGKGGKTISKVESEAGIKINVQPLMESSITPNIVKRKKEIVLKVGKNYAGREASVILNGEVIFSGSISKQGEIKVKRQSNIGKKIIEAIASNIYPVVKIK